mmetsp:Transcript_58203/g.104167  ORF Transcript_58203/g.104167 Transcript_58203/m.104167 type:complete len:312 (+) Transcript_58203:113-1048(+)
MQRVLSATPKYLQQSVCGLSLLQIFFFSVGFALLASQLFSSGEPEVYWINGESNREADTECGWPTPPSQCAISPNRLFLQPGAVVVVDDFLDDMEIMVLRSIVEEGIVSAKPEYNKREDEKLNTSFSSVAALPDPELKPIMYGVLRRIHGNAVRTVHGLTAVKDGPWAYKGVYFPDFWSIRRYHNQGHRGASANKMDVHPDTGVYARCLSAVLFFGEGVRGGTFRTHRCKYGNCRAYGWQFNDTWPAIDPALLQESNLQTLAQVDYKAGRLVFFLAETLHDVTETLDGNRDVVFMWFGCVPPMQNIPGVRQ